MTNFALRVSALLCVLSSVTPACAWSEARPTLVLQLSRVERARKAMEGTQRAQEFVLSASVSMAVDTAEVESRTAIAADGNPLPFSSPGNPFDATAAVPVDRASEPVDVEPPAAAGLDLTEASSFDAANGCGQSPTLCAWAYAAEDAALVAVVERHGAEL